MEIVHRKGGEIVALRELGDRIETSSSDDLLLPLLMVTNLLIFDVAVGYTSASNFAMPSGFGEIAIMLDVEESASSFWAD
jgi:hypothetical protein